MFTYYMPTQVFFGKGCIAESGQVLADLGKRALLVTGRHSAKVNGSQDAFTGKLDELGISWYLFDDVENNPSIDTIRRAAAFAKEKGVDFVVGIGGGSPMDAAKALPFSARMISMMNNFSRGLIKSLCPSWPCRRQPERGAK
mgnify:CR=1 FL=1